MNARMTALKHCAIATTLVLSTQAALACDDADEEMKMAAAYEAAKVAQAQARQVPSPGQDAAGPASAGPAAVAVTGTPVQTADAAQR